jgi:ATP-dependent exoDNAse (exonuclease V) alpha subunit
MNGQLDFLSKPRTGVRFIEVVEIDEVPLTTDTDEISKFPPRPLTIKTAVAAYHELVSIHGPENVIGIAPFKDKTAGVKELNNAIRATLGYDDPMPRIGELLMITDNRNKAAPRALNGERYRAVIVDIDRKILRARLIGVNREIILPLEPHMRGPAKHVDWGYISTVHKYQGSEADAVLVVIPSGTLKFMTAAGGGREPWFFDRSCLYTACSRPKLSLMLVGDPIDICGAIEFNRSNRITALSRMFAAEAA